MSLPTSAAFINLALQKPKYFIGAYPGEIIFGEVFQFEYVVDRSFCIHRFEFGDFFLSIVKLIESLSRGKTSLGKIKIIMLSNDVHKYFWNIENEESISLEIVKNAASAYKTDLSLPQLNNLIHFFYELIPASILLQKIETDLFVNLSSLSLKEILSLKESTKVVENFEYPVEKLGTLSILINLNLDIIILMHKLRLLIKTDYFDANITNLNGN